MFEPSTATNGWQRTAERIEQVLDLVNAGLLAVMVVTLSWQVFGRYVLSHAPSWSEELARFSLAWMTMFAAAAALRNGQHISVTTLLAAVPPRVQQVLMVLRDLCILATAAIFGWSGLQFAMMNATQESAGLEVSMAVPYASLVVGALLLIVQLTLSRLGGTPIPVDDGEDPTT